MSLPRWFTYQWTRDGVPISGAVSSTYLIQDADGGHSIGALVTAANFAGAVTAAAAPELHIPMSAPHGILLAVEGPSIVAFTGNVVLQYTHLDPATKSSVCALSNSNLTVKQISSGSLEQISARSVLSKSSGKLYCEFAVDNSAVVDHTSVGLTTAAANPSSYLGNVGSAAYMAYRSSDGAFSINNLLNTSMGLFASGDGLRMAADLDAKLIWWWCSRQGTWNRNPAANPATGVGGASLASLTGPFFVAIECFAQNDQISVAFGPTFSFGAPTGFLPWAG